MSQEFPLAIYRPDLGGQLATLSGGRPFVWNSAEREKAAKERFEAAILATDVEEKGQARLQLQETLKLTFVDFLQRHKLGVSFEHQLREGFSLNTGEIFLSPEVFDLIKILEEYPYPRVFGQNGLDLGLVRIAQGKGGGVVLELRFLSEVCIVYQKSD